MEQSVRDVVRLSSWYVLVKKLKGGCTSLFRIHHDQCIGSSFTSECISLMTEAASLTAEKMLKTSSVGRQIS